MSDLGFIYTKPFAQIGFRRNDSTESYRKATRVGFACVAALTEFLSILGAFFLADFSYNKIIHGWTAGFCVNAELGAFAAIMFTASNFARHSYSVSDYLDFSGHAERTLLHWNIAFLTAATVGFLAHAIEDSSRGAFLVFYLVGLCAIYASRASLVSIIKRNAKKGSVLAARVLIVGFERDVDKFMRIQPLDRRGMRIVAIQTLREEKGCHSAQLAEAVELARRVRPDEIIIVIPWERPDVIGKCVTAFMRVPAAVHLHLGEGSPLHHFGGRKVTADGTISSFRLPAYAMSESGLILKRICDIVLSSVALALLTPVFFLAAIAIKVDSKGPVLFIQTRHGFNKVPFRIFKFRSMTTMEDGGEVKQATSDDPRITRVGSFLRKYNIDELPQLFNVLRGEMSLVGPRPHALVHDEAFESEVTLYARRHNVKPGITGWAQVNGFRGETNTTEKISQRIHFDLHYIDNWSFAFDVWIMFLTLFSPKAYKNAA
jgi:Undecaprenyl-phosphate glucose phosphotransferase